MADMSLDEYIKTKDFLNPYRKINPTYVKQKSESKFDRYKDKNDDDDDMDIDPDMPKLVSIKTSFSQQKLDDMKGFREQRSVNVNTQKQTKQSVHSRLGDITENNGVGKVKRQRNNSNNRFNKSNDYNGSSVHHRLNTNFVNPAIVARNNIVANSINAVMQNAIKCMSEGNGWVNNMIGAMSLPSNQAGDSSGKKYDMQVQREIHTIQGKSLFYKCPGAAVVSSDGPGLEEPLTIPQNSTDMSLNQRFA